MKSVDVDEWVGVRKEGNLYGMRKKDQKKIKD